MIKMGKQAKKRAKNLFQFLYEQPSKKFKSWTKVDLEIRLDGINHYPKKKKELKNPLRYHEKNCVKQTRYICEKCEKRNLFGMYEIISLINYY